MSIAKQGTGRNFKEIKTEKKKSQPMWVKWTKIDRGEREKLLNSIVLEENKDSPIGQRVELECHSIYLVANDPS